MSSLVPRAASGRMLRAAFQSLWFDLRVATKHVLRNTLGGSILVPRVLRVVVYRLCGFRLQSANIAEGQILLCPPRSLHVGPDVTISRGCYFEGSGRIAIGPSTLVGQEVAFITSSHAVDALGTIARTPIYKEISVGRDCWIGARATLVGGASVGDGCVVVAGSVVTGACEPGFVYAGVPARRIGRTSALAGSD